MLMPVKLARLPRLEGKLDLDESPVDAGANIASDLYIFGIFNE
jgi:hypothetical protein